MIKKIIQIIDRLVVRTSHWKHIPGSKQDLFYVVPHRYQGKPLILNEEITIQAGDWIAELHVDNTKMIFLNGQLKAIYRALSQELNSLAMATLQHKDYQKIVAFYGQTVLHPILRKKGFIIKPIENRIKRFAMGLGENLLRLAYATGGRKIRFYEPRICWLPKTRVINLYKGSTTNEKTK